MGPDQAVTIQANHQLEHAAHYQNLIVAYRNGAPVRLKDVAKAVDSVENDRLASWYNGAPGILLGVQRQPDANTVAVVDSVKALLPMFEAELPASVKLNVLLDHSISIRQSVSDVQYTLLLTAVLVILVIFLFLRNITATIIPALALPISVIGTFAGMEVMGYSIDNLSLMALTLSVGFVVDDAIVMLENIVRHVEGGERVMEAALRGSREIAFTILSITLSLVAVFIPVLFMGGVVGRVFHEFAVTISMTILISGFVSLTLTPMLASRLLKPHRAEHHNLVYRMSENGFNALFNAYRESLTVVLRWRRTTLFVTILSLALSGYLFAVIPKGFFPTVDAGVLIGSTVAAQDISVASMAQHMLAVSKVAPGRSQYQRRHRFHRHQRPESGAQRRQAFHPAKAAIRAQAFGHRDRTGVAPEDGADHRHQHLLPGAAGHPARRAPVAESISIHVAGRRHDRALSLRAADAAAHGAVARRSGRDLRPAAQ